MGFAVCWLTPAREQVKRTHDERLTHPDRKTVIARAGFQSQCEVMRKNCHEAIIFIEQNRDTISELNRRLFPQRGFALEPPRERFYHVGFAANFLIIASVDDGACRGWRRVSWPTGANKLFPSSQSRKPGAAKRAHETGVDSAAG
ncbi:MAG: hypothetical protein ACREQN_04160 [Candidatus Binataceae bacterium]